MINRKNNKWITRSLCALAIAGLGLSIGGCGSEEEEQVVVAPPPPAPLPPPAPSVTPIEQLMVDLNIDRRVNLPEEKAPDNDVDRKAVLEFFDAMARGNDRALRGLLAETDKRELDAMVDSGVWKEAASQIKRIDVETGANMLIQKCALAVIEVGASAVTDFQPQLWYYMTELEEPIFEAAPTPPGVLDKLSGDRIAAWHQILVEELLLADKPEIEYDMTQKNLDSGGGDQPSSSGPSTPGRGPSPAPPGRPLPPPIQPPGGPAFGR